ncbi:unnamed protein product [Cladocopium goreaui]|uniref:Uncharacterized protein n=1 Tax=Cladocopium goreaui TaxID=2562237 RepID=A0A9P1D5I5_9DINO|nr:unnamed protein product [Cladocopium goreaui]
MQPCARTSFGLLGPAAPAAPALCAKKGPRQGWAEIGGKTAVQASGCPGVLHPNEAVAMPLQALVQIILPAPDDEMEELAATLNSWPDDVTPEWPEIQKQLEDVKQKHQRPDYVFRYLLPNDDEKKLYDLNDEINFDDLVRTYDENKKPDWEPPLVLPLVLAAPSQTTWDPAEELPEMQLTVRNTFLEFGQAQRLQDILKKNVTSHI